MAGPLEGFRVVDLTSMISGPVATQLLADQGADVVKVEPLTGDLVRYMGSGKDGRTGTFLSSNRNKRSLALDLKAEDGRKILSRLVSTADVFVQNFRPGTAERMGLGEAAVRAMRPDIIYVSISGFGETGPYSKKRVYDPLIQALSGLASIQADRETGRPKMIRTIIPDKLTAMTAAQAITAALLARARTGEGQHVKVSMLDAMISFLWPEGLVQLTFPGQETQVSRAQLAQDLVFETADGFMTVGAVSDSEWQGLCAALGQEQWLEDERFDTPHKRVVNADARLKLTQETLINRTTAEWLEVLDGHDVPCAPILDRAGLLSHPQVQANQAIEELEDPLVGPYRQPRPAARFSQAPYQPPDVAPRLGEQSEEILGEIGYSESEIAALRKEGVIKGPAL
ncbi:MAG: CoA transferase [Alphaproteobacteria bacterium]|nr:MAG: CoA transferase [Alphaproteobacteria bacterium]